MKNKFSKKYKNVLITKSAQGMAKLSLVSLGGLNAIVRYAFKPLFIGKDRLRCSVPCARILNTVSGLFAMNQTKVGSTSCARVLSQLWSGKKGRRASSTSCARVLSSLDGFENNELRTGSTSCARALSLFGALVFAMAIPLSILFVQPQQVDAQTNTLNFQGRLLTNSGTLVPDGNYHIEFKLYNALSSVGSSQGSCAGDANCLWTETLSTGNLVTIRDGYFSVYLGDVTSLPDIDWSQALYLGMNVGGDAGAASWDGEMSPRFRLTSVPYAFTSRNVATNDTNAVSTDSDNVTIQTGDALGATSDSGNITIDVGTATQNAGSVSLGATNASAITIGNTSATTTLQGPVSLTGTGTALTVTNNVQVNGNTTLGSDTSDTLTVEADATFNGSLTVSSGDVFTNAGATLFGATAIGNIAGGGNIGSAAATVDVATTFDVNQTTAGQTLTLPAPTNTASGRIVYVNNVGSTNFTMYGETIETGSSSTFIWNGSSWTTSVSFSNTGVDTIGALDGGTPSANGAEISGTTLYLQSASATQPGLINTASQAFAGVKTFNDELVAAGGLTVSVGENFVNQGSTLFDSIAVADVAGGGNIGTAATTVDVATTFDVNQTTAGQTLTLPNPTTATSGRIAFVNNVGSVSFTMYDSVIAAGQSNTFIWNGSAWITTVSLSGSVVNTIGTIDSQTKSADGAVISANAIYLQTADATYPGLVSAGAQTFAGAKTFNDTLTVNPGTITDSGSAQSISVTLGNDADVDVVSALSVSATSAATGDADQLVGLYIQDLAGDNPTVGEAAILIGNNWDVALALQDTSARVAIADVLRITDLTGSTGNDLFTIDVNGTVGDVGVTGALTAAGLTTLNGGLTIEAGDTFTFNSDAFTDLTGNGLQVSSNALTLQVQANKGLEVDANGISLVDCGDGQILQYSTGSSSWACADPDTGSDEIITVAADDSTAAQKAAADYVADNTDDHLTINTAITSLGANGGTVQLLPGTFTVDGSIEITSNVTLAGSGQEATTIIAEAGALAAQYDVIENANPGSTDNNITIRDLTIDGNKDNVTGNNVEGILFDTVGSGSGATYVRGFLIENVTVTDTEGNGIDIDTSANGSIKNVTVKDFGAANGIRLLDSDYIRIEGSDIIDGLADGLFISASDNNIVYGNFIDDNGNNGLELNGATRDNVIDGNRITNSSDHGIELSGGGAKQYNIISNNYIGNNTDRGFTSVNAYHNTITGNQFYTNDASGVDSHINLGGSGANNVVTNNVIRESSSDGSVSIAIASGNATTYVADNLIDNVGAVADSSTSTIYANQMDASDNLVLQASGTADVLINSDTVIDGRLTIGSGFNGCGVIPFGLCDEIYVQNNQTITDTAANIYAGNSTWLTLNPAASSSAELIGTDLGVVVNGSSDTDTLSGYVTKVLNASSGTLSSATGSEIIVATQGGSSGDITNARGLVVGVYNDGSGTIDNAASLVVNTAEGDNSTNLLIGTGTIPTGNYSIYNSSVLDNYFAGNLELNQNLEVNGNTTIGDASGDTLTVNAGSIQFANNFTSCTAINSDASGNLGCDTSTYLTSATISLQGAYEGGNTLLATDAEGDIDFEVSEATSFIVDVAGTGSFQIQDSGTAVLTVDETSITLAQPTINIGATVATAINIGNNSSTTTIDGGNVYTSGNTSVLSGNSFTVQSGSTLLTGPGTAANTLTINNHTGTGNILEVQDAATAVFTIADGGAVVLQNTTDSTAGFQILDADGGTAIFTVDTTNERVGIGTSAPVAGFEVATDISVASNRALKWNAYYNGANDVYLADGSAVQQWQDEGADFYRFYAAAAGTAGNPISFQEAFAIDLNSASLGDVTFDSGTLYVDASANAVNIGNSGTLQVAGLTTLNGGLTIEAGDTFTFNSDAFTDFTGGGLVNTGGVLSVDTTSASGFFQNGGNTFGATAVLGTDDAYGLSFETSDTERLAIEASGNVIVSSGNLLVGNGGTSGLLRISDGSSNTLSVDVQALAGDYTVSVPTISSNDTFCLQGLNNCASLNPNLTDNITNALDIQEGTNNYININTTNSLENISFGNATTNPSYNFLGSGTLTVAGPSVFNNTLTQNAGTITNTGAAQIINFTLGDDADQDQVVGLLVQPTSVNGGDYDNLAAVYAAPITGYANTWEVAYASGGGYDIDYSVTDTDAVFAVGDGGTYTFNGYNGSTFDSLLTITDAGSVGDVGITGALQVAGLTTLNGGLTVEAGDTFTFNSDAFTDFTGGGLINTGGVLSVDTTSATGFFRNGGNDFGGTATLGTNDANSLVFEVGGVDALTIADGGAITVQNETDSTTGFQVLDADGGLPVFNVDTTNERVGIGTATPNALLEVAGASLTDQLRITYNATWYTNLYTDGAGDFTITPSGGNTSISGTLSVSSNADVVDLAVDGGDLTTTAGTFNLVDTNATTVNAFGAATSISLGAATGTTTVNNGLTVNGPGLFQNASDSTSAFQVVTAAAGTNRTLLNVDTTNELITVKSTVFDAATVQAFTGSGNITQSNIDGFGTILISSDAAGYTATLQDPTSATAGRLVYVTNTGSFDMTLAANSGGSLQEVTLKPNTSATMVWNGSDWTAAGASSSTDLQAAYNNTATSAGGAELILNAPGGAADGLTVRNNATTPITGGLLEIQTSIGSNLFSVNNNATEFASNGGAETAGASAGVFPSSTWSAPPTGGTVSRFTTTGNNVATGQASVQVVTAGTDDGAANDLATALTPNLEYTVSFTVRGLTNFTTLDVDYSRDGTNTSTTACDTGRTVTSGQWSRITCTFTAPSSGITASNAIFIRQSDGTARTFYIDNLSVNINASATYAADGSVDNSGAFGTNWTNFDGGAGSSVVTEETSIIYDTSASAEVATSANANQGIRNNLAIDPATNTQYLVSFYARTDTTMSGSLAVGFLPTGGTSTPSGTAACTDYNTQSLTAGVWTKVTCLFTTTGTTITNPDLVIYQTDSTARSIFIDALSITLNTNNSNNVQVGGGNLGGPVTLFTLDRSAGNPIADNNEAYLGSMYYDTITGRIQCYEADGWGACGAAPDNVVNLNPEYAGAVLNGSGVGTMTADFCSNDVDLSVNSTFCGSGEAKNFYNWTSPQATEQTYSIYVTYQLPETFNGFSSDDTVQLVGRVDNTSNASVTYEMFRSTGSDVSQCGTGETDVITGGGGSADTWYSYGINGNESTGCGLNAAAAGDFIIFKINLKAQSNANAYVSTLSFVTTGR